MCNHCHEHSHSHGPEIVQLMPISHPLFAVYQSPQPPAFASDKGKNNLSLVPVLFMGLIRHGEKSMVEGFLLQTLSSRAKILTGSRDMQHPLTSLKSCMRNVHA